MDVESWLSIIVFILLLFFSAFFSGSESAYFSLTQIDLRQLREEKEKSRTAARILRLIGRPKTLLTTILIGNTIVNVAAATVAALFTARVLAGKHLGADAAMLIEIVVVTVIILIFSEVSPKVFAVKQPVRLSRRVAWILSGIVTVLYPLTYILEMMTRGISKTFRVEREIPFVTEEELKTLIQVGEEKGTLDSLEREMIHSIFEFRGTLVREIMIPRMDMVSVDINTPIEDVLQVVKEKGHSRIPVFEEKVDNIVGVLVVKDVLPYLHGNKSLPALSDLLRKAYFVPESKLIDELLREFQKERTHIAVVVDEYGGTSGLVTLEDVIEEIVGEIRDEFDREKPLIRNAGKDDWLVDAKINIVDLNEELNLNLPVDDDYESLGGFIFSQLGSVPKDKDQLIYEGIQLVVERVQGQRIRLVRLIRNPSGADQKE